MLLICFLGSIVYIDIYNYILEIPYNVECVILIRRLQGKVTSWYFDSFFHPNSFYLQNSQIFTNLEKINQCLIQEDI